MDEAGDIPLAEAIAEEAKSIRAAADQPSDLPDDPREASDRELVILLSESRILGAGGRNVTLLRNPLAYGSGSSVLYWEDLTRQPANDYTDPAFLVYQRGRSVVPALIDALEDFTATRCVYSTRSPGVPSAVVQRADLAVALIEAISRCRFYHEPELARGRNRLVLKWFSERDPAFRGEVTVAIRQWWEATKDLSPLDARSWLISRSEYLSAEQMIDVLALEGHSARAIEHLRSFAIGADGAVDISVIHRLAELGDWSGLDILTQKLGDQGTMDKSELRLLLLHGGPREYKLIRRLLAEDISRRPDEAARFTRFVLDEIARIENPLAIPILIEALQYARPPDGMAEHVTARFSTPARVYRAAGKIQELTQRDFGYEPRGDAAGKLEAVDAIRAWWDAEGRGIYGFAAARDRRGHGIR